MNVKWKPQKEKEDRNHTTSFFSCNYFQWITCLFFFFFAHNPSPSIFGLQNWKVLVLNNCMNLWISLLVKQANMTHKRKSRHRCSNSKNNNQNPTEITFNNIKPIPITKQLLNELPKIMSFSRTVGDFHQITEWCSTVDFHAKRYC